MHTPSPTRYQLFSSRGLDRDVAAGQASRLQDKCVTIPPGQTLRICDITGPGRIVRMWFTTPLLGRPNLLRDVIWRMFWDDEQHPSVESPIGDLFGAAFGQPRSLVSDRLVVAGGGYLCRFEMPFSTRALVEIENQSPHAVRNFFFQIGAYIDEPIDSTRPRFHAQWQQSNPTTPGQPVQILDAHGRGHFVGMKVDLQNRTWWLRPPFRQIALPRGFGLGLLEGWETIRVDDEPNPSINGTGAEDYFSGGFYFQGGPFHTPTHGVSHRSFLMGRVSAYRFHIDDPIPFDRRIQVTLDHGFQNSMEGDYSTVAFWYQTEPHTPFPELLPAASRRPRAPLINMAQPAIIALLTVSALGLLAWLVSRMLT